MSHVTGWVSDEDVTMSQNVINQKTFVFLLFSNLISYIIFLAETSL